MTPSENHRVTKYAIAYLPLSLAPNAGDPLWAAIRGMDYTGAILVTLQHAKVEDPVARPRLRLGAHDALIILCG